MFIGRKTLPVVVRSVEKIPGWNGTAKPHSCLVCYLIPTIFFVVLCRSQEQIIVSIYENNQGNDMMNDDDDDDKK